MFLLRSVIVNKAQWNALRQCIYLLDKSRECAYYEPLQAQETHEQFVHYVRSLMDHIENRSIEKWEADNHLWALHKTLEIRITKVRELARWKPKKAS